MNRSVLIDEDKSSRCLLSEKDEIGDREDFFTLYNKRAVDIRACAQVINDNHPNYPLLVRKKS